MDPVNLTAWRCVAVLCALVALAQKNLVRGLLVCDPVSAPHALLLRADRSIVVELLTQLHSALVFIGHEGSTEVKAQIDAASGNDLARGEQSAAEEADDHIRWAEAWTALGHAIDPMP